MSGEPPAAFDPIPPSLRQRERVGLTSRAQGLTTIFVWVQLVLGGSQHSLPREKRVNVSQVCKVCFWGLGRDIPAHETSSFTVLLWLLPPGHPVGDSATSRTLDWSHLYRTGLKPNNVS